MEEKMIRYDHTTPPTDREWSAICCLMEEAFPKEERRRSSCQRALFSDVRYCLYADYEEECLLGFLAAWRLREFRFIEHFAVAADLRGRGIGGRLLRGYLALDSLAVVLEAEPPRTQIAERRIGFYQRNGFALLPYDYAQPPLQDGSGPIPLCLMGYGVESDRDTFLRVRDELYHSLYMLTDEQAAQWFGQTV